MPSTTYEALRRGAERDPKKIALQFFLRGSDYADALFYTYQDVIDLLTQSANMFHGLGVEEQDVISVILPNIPQAYFAILGGQTVATVQPIDPLLEVDCIAGMMNAAGTKVVVTLASFPATDIWQRVVAAIDQVATVETILKVDLLNYLPRFQRWAIRLSGARGSKTSASRAKALDYGLVARRFPVNELASDRNVQPADMAMMFPIKGPDGQETTVSLSHDNLLSAAASCRQAVGLVEKDIVLCSTPLYKIEGIVLGSLVPWSEGASVILGAPSGFRDDDLVINFWQIIDFFKINLFHAGAGDFEKLNSVAVEESDVASLSRAICTTNLLKEDVLREFELLASAPVLQGLSFVQTSGLVTLNPIDGSRRVGSWGLPLRNLMLKVAKFDPQGAYRGECAVEEHGELIASGDQVFARHADDQVNKSMWSDGDREWFRTGIEVYSSSDGFIWPVTM